MKLPEIIFDKEYHWLKIELIVFEKIFRSLEFRTLNQYFPIVLLLIFPLLERTIESEGTPTDALTVSISHESTEKFETLWKTIAVCSLPETELPLQKRWMSFAL